MKFIADVMLGRLAKRLRLLGFDVLYDRSLDDNEIIRLSLEQGRVILTRDTRLASRPLASNHLVIENDQIPEQLRQVFAAFSIHTIEGALTRCSRCNEFLIPMRKRDAKDLVPQYIYEKNDDFLQCPSCGRIYWEGTHVEKMGSSFLKRKKA